MLLCSWSNWLPLPAGGGPLPAQPETSPSARSAVQQDRALPCRQPVIDVTTRRAAHSPLAPLTQIDCTPPLVNFFPLTSACSPASPLAASYGPGSSWSSIKRYTSPASVSTPMGNPFLAHISAQALCRLTLRPFDR